MITEGTGFNIEIEIDSLKGTGMKDLDFKLEFYVHPNRRVYFRKEDLVHVAMSDGDKFYALLNTAGMGHGQLMCRATIQDAEPKWKGGSRPVIINQSTGRMIGGGFLPTSHHEEYEEGYRIRFNFVYGLPKPEVAYIFYGKFVDQINSFDELTPEMLVSPDNKIISVSAGKMGKTPINDIVAGNKVLVLVPSDYGYVATKDNGIGGKVPFDTSIMGCNGEKQLSVDGTTYNIYGEFMTVSGQLFIYVD